MLLELAIAYVICFLSLLFAFIWISTLSVMRKEIIEVKKTDKFPFISMIIPAWNEEEMIGETLKSLLAAGYPKDKFEVIVVANNCTDKTADVVRTFKDKSVKLMEVFWDRRKFMNSKSHAENLALAKARGEIVGVMDADSIVTPDVFALMAPHFQNNAVGAVISTVKVYQPQNFLEKIQWAEFIVGNLLKRLMSLLGVFFITSGACNLYRKDVLQKLGGFDEESMTEDAEVATRMLYNKYEVISQMNAVVYARAAKTVKAFHTQRLRWFRGLLAIMFKYRNVLFNKEYGALGFIFFLYLSIFGMLVLVDVLLVLTLVRLAANIFYFVAGGGQEVLPYSLSFLKQYIFTANIVFVAFTFAILLCGIYLLVHSHKYLKESPWKYPLATITFLTFYQMLIAMYWLLAIIYEMAKTKKLWRGKTRW